MTPPKSNLRRRDPFHQEPGRIVASRKINRVQLTFAASPATSSTPPGDADFAALLAHAMRIEAEMQRRPPEDQRKAALQRRLFPSQYNNYEP